MPNKKNIAFQSKADHPGMCVFSYPRCVFTARAYVRAVLGVVILSVCLSAHAWIVTKLKNTLRIFWHYTKEQSLLLQRAIDGVRMLPLSPERVAQKAIFSFFGKKSTSI